MKLDLPAFGMPSSPTSASTLSSNVRRRLSPGSPRVNCRGARFTLDLKCTLPRPPWPPRASTTRSWSFARSATRSPVSASRMMVPTGTGRSMSGPAAPLQFELPPRAPSFARWMRAKRYSTSVLILRSARAHTLPPRPPSPPSGPPRGTYFSRRKCAAPLPPLPACTSILASSMNFMARNKKALSDFDRASCGRDRLSRGISRPDLHNVVAVCAAHPVLHLARDARVERMVAADADVVARVHARAPRRNQVPPAGDRVFRRGSPRAALANQDRAGRHALAAVDLHAQALRLGIAAVSRAAACF